jgi:general secretion pathway protein B
MSYILDALKKAEAERHQGVIPTLHAQPAAALSSDIGVPGTRNRLVLILIGMLLIALGGLAWLRPWQTTAPVNVEASVPAPMPTPAAPAHIDTANAAPTIVAIAPDPVPAPATPAPAMAKPQPAAPVASTASGTRDNGLQAGKTAQTVINPPAVQQAASSNPAPTAIPGDIPSVSLGGYIYSDTPSERQLLVNKRLMHEGEEVMPGLVLEKMLPKAAVFNYRGYRYQVAY